MDVRGREAVSGDLRRREAVSADVRCAMGVDMQKK
ncbi:hypothetical protein ROS217_16306 [Roseovarius sp. 217]|nr:hypothetical protein ROS217_16306 [Roseovarius sp. 217]